MTSNRGGGVRGHPGLPEVLDTGYILKGNLAVTAIATFFKEGSLILLQGFAPV